ncbi:MAG TPA: hypothetical protein VM163_03730 [bacterium]|nr:hypothetical protein [bacterium]
MKSEERLPHRVTAYLFTRRLLARIQNGVKAVHRGFFLGFLDPSELQVLTNHHYTSTQSGDSGDVNYHDAAYNLSGLRYWEQRVIEKYFADCRSILLGSAGGGREVLALSRMGFLVDAFECNPQLMAKCQSFLELHGVEATVIQAEPGGVPVTLGTYDGAILGWGAYIHVFGRRRRVELLREFRQHLCPGAPLFLSFWAKRNSMSRRLSYRLAKFIRAIRGAEPVEAGDSISSTFDRSFTENEVREELAEAGFEMVFYSEESFGHAVGRA